MTTDPAERNQYVVLIPAYKPNEALLRLVSELVRRGVRRIVVVDDGSGPEYAGVFEKLEAVPQCEVVRHAVNLGKGRALKTGLNHILLRHADCAGVVTCDADGQHSPEDVVRLGEALAESPRSLILGSRSFAGDVPLRSRLGNLITRYVFYYVVGKKLTDTQSGLRAIPRMAIPELLRLSGEQYEYEMNMLMLAKERGVEIREEPISTIYLDNNLSSHFNPLFDSMKIYFVLLRYGFTSFLTALLDQLIFFLAFRSGVAVAPGIVLARLLSSIFNLTMNKTFVFQSRARLPGLILKYYTTMAVAGTIVYAMIQLLTEAFGWGVITAKITVESVLFLATFVVQRDYVFTRPKFAAE
jgi:glycosyltransferase involved in cell wall biosynthesis